MDTSTEYTGHGENTGGLQAHSVGSLYPFTIVAQPCIGWELIGKPMRLEMRVVYRWMDTRTGKMGKRYGTYKAAVDSITLH